MVAKLQPPAACAASRGRLGFSMLAGVLRTAAWSQAALRSCTALVNPSYPPMVTNAVGHLPALSPHVSSASRPHVPVSTAALGRQLCMEVMFWWCSQTAPGAMQCGSDPGWLCMPLGRLPCTTSQPSPAPCCCVWLGSVGRISLRRAIIFSQRNSAQRTHILAYLGCPCETASSLPVGADLEPKQICSRRNGSAVLALCWARAGWFMC